jgi:hypothetical protein
MAEPNGFGVAKSLDSFKVHRRHKFRTSLGRVNILDQHELFPDEGSQFPENHPTPATNSYGTSQTTAHSDVHNGEDRPNLQSRRCDGELNRERAVQLKVQKAASHQRRRRVHRLWQEQMDVRERAKIGEGSDRRANERDLRFSSERLGECPAKKRADPEEQHRVAQECAGGVQQSKAAETADADQGRVTKHATPAGR